MEGWNHGVEDVEEWNSRRRGNGPTSREVDGNRAFGRAFRGVIHNGTKYVSPPSNRPAYANRWLSSTVPDSLSKCHSFTQTIGDIDGYSIEIIALSAG